MVNKVIVYSTPTCVYCRMAKDFFKKHGINFTEINVLVDEEARREMADKSHQMGVPVIDIDGEVFVGFNRVDLEKALGLK